MQAPGAALIGKVEQSDSIAGPCEVPDERAPRGHRLLHAVDADEEVGTFTEEHVGDFEAIDREHRFLHDQRPWVLSWRPDRLSQRAGNGRRLRGFPMAAILRSGLRQPSASQYAPLPFIPAQD